MKITDSSLKVKRGNKKLLSLKTAIRIKTYILANHPDDKQMIKKMNRQIMCAERLEVYSNGAVKAFFCKEKTCLICNSIRLARFLSKTMDYIDQDEDTLYHMVLTVKNPSQEDLEEVLNKMYGFFRNSSLRKNKRYRELNKVIKFIRSFEATLNERSRSYHLHFHIALVGSNEKEIKEYGNLILDYWLKYFGDKANRKAQYLEEQKKSILENFKYLFKMNDISDSNIHMVYHLLKATHGRRLFTSKNFPKVINSKEELENIKFNDIEGAYIKDTFRYKKDFKNWINPSTGEVFVLIKDEKKFEEEIEKRKEERKINAVERMNYKELKEYFNNKSFLE